MKYLVLFFLLFGSASLYAQWFPGKAIYNNGDTVEGKVYVPMDREIQVPQLSHMQLSIRFQPPNGKKVRLSPKKVKDIRFTIKGLEYKMASREHSGVSIYGDRYYFMRLIVEGPANLLEYTDGREIFSYVQRGDEPLHKVRWIGFKVDLIQYFSDCPDLGSRIDDREYKRSELEELVTFYNKNCNEGSN